MPTLLTHSSLVGHQPSGSLTPGRGLSVKAVGCCLVSTPVAPAPPTCCQRQEKPEGLPPRLLAGSTDHWAGAESPGHT